MFFLPPGSCLTHSAPTLFTILDKQGRCIIKTIQYGISPLVYWGLEALISFVIPCIVIIICYFNIWRALTDSKVTKGLTGGKNSKEKQKATRIVIVLVVFFAICSLPRSILTVGISLASTIGSDYKLINRLIFALYWSTLSLFINSAINPMLYTLSGTAFRKHVICFKKQSSPQDVTI